MMVIKRCCTTVIQNLIIIIKTLILNICDIETNKKWLSVKELQGCRKHDRN